MRSVRVLFSRNKERTAIGGDPAKLVGFPPRKLHLVDYFLALPKEEMKGSCTLLASLLAASTVAISSTSYAANPDGLGYSSSTKKLRSNKSRDLPLTLEKEKFAPTFDGLKFIETLVTAHR